MDLGWALSLMIGVLLEEETDTQRRRLCGDGGGVWSYVAISQGVLVITRS